MSKVITFFSLLLASVTVRAQPSETDLTKDLTRFFSLYPQENAVLISDNSVYLAGEKIWYKVYLWNGENTGPLSSDVRIFLRQADGKVIEEQRILMAKGEGQGDIALSDTLRSDVYLLELYSDWMQNFSRKPVARKLITVSNGVPSLDNDLLARNSQILEIESGLIRGRYAKFAAFTGHFASRPFSIEISAPDGTLVKKEYNGIFSRDSIRIEQEGSYTFLLCTDGVGECFKRVERTQLAGLELVRQNDHAVTLRTVGQIDNYWLAVCNTERLLETRAISTYAEIDTRGLPGGFINFLLIDKSDKRIGGTVTIFNKSRQQPLEPSITNESSGYFPIVSIRFDSKVLKPHLVIIPTPTMCGHHLPATLADRSLLNALSLKNFFVFDRVNAFMASGALPIRSKPGFQSALIDLPRMDLIDVYLSEFNDRDKVHAALAAKARIARVEADYNVGEESDYAALPADEVYMPSDYPTISTVEEFLKIGIPRLKVKNNGDLLSYHFFYTNLKGQKKMYDLPAALIVNGYRVPTFALLSQLSKADVKTISVIYNSETLVESNLQKLLPGGAIVIALQPSTSTMKKLQTLKSFATPFKWPHNVPHRHFAERNPEVRFPLFSNLYFWSGPYESRNPIRVRLPRSDIQPTSLKWFTMDGIIRGNYDQLILNVISD